MFSWTVAIIAIWGTTALIYALVFFKSKPSLAKLDLELPFGLPAFRYDLAATLQFDSSADGLAGAAQEAAMSGIVSLFSVAANLLTRQVMLRMTKFEQHASLTEESTSLLTKLSLVYILNYVLVYLLVYSSDWYSDKGLLPQMIIIALIDGLFLLLSDVCCTHSITITSLQVRMLNQITLAHLPLAGD